ncbi:MAG TPA: hypothetical protein VFO54_10955 [Chryseosolibacter sp.]|nr:hypothetical protein [Chryseosolibacter sp.]
MRKTKGEEKRKKPGPSDWHHKNKSEKHEENYKRKTKPFEWGNGPGK